jgi:hypothetical protein
MAKVSHVPTVLLSPKPQQPKVPRQLSMAFESAVTLELIGSDRTEVVTQLATLLMQAAGLVAGGDDEHH